MTAPILTIAPQLVKSDLWAGLIHRGMSALRHHRWRPARIGRLARALRLGPHGAGGPALPRDGCSSGPGNGAGIASVRPGLCASVWKSRPKPRHLWGSEGAQAARRYPDASPAPHGTRKARKAPTPQVTSSRGWRAAGRSRRKCATALGNPQRIAARRGRSILCGVAEATG